MKTAPKKPMPFTTKNLKTAGKAAEPMIDKKTAAKMAFKKKNAKK